MSVVVIGMEMPKKCEDCEIETCDENYYGDEFNHRCSLLYKGYTSRCRNAGRPNWCPLRPLPEKHGRLIDVDAMERVMSDTVQGDIRGYPYSDTLWDMAFEWLDHQPTIVEAEGEP